MRKPTMKQMKPINSTHVQNFGQFSRLQAPIPLQSTEPKCVWERETVYMCELVSLVNGVACNWSTMSSSSISGLHKYATIREIWQVNLCKAKKIKPFHFSFFVRIFYNSSSLCGWCWSCCCCCVCSASAERDTQKPDWWTWTTKKRLERRRSTRGNNNNNKKMRHVTTEYEFIQPDSCNYTKRNGQSWVFGATPFFVVVVVFVVGLMSDDYNGAFSRLNSFSRCSLDYKFLEIFILGRSGKKAGTMWNISEWERESERKKTGKE